jgi:chemotaxis family two-component system sensor histidine kinase/response regulator PixL
MAINPDIRDQAYQFFIEEAPELLQIIETGLLKLNQEHSTAKVHSLMRAAHSLKGGASSIGLDAIATLAHRLENIFKALYDDTLAADSDLENWLLQAYDCLRLPLIEQITTGAFDQAQALAAAEPIFNRVEEHCGEALTQAENYIPSSTEMGVDLVHTIFEVDVAEGLEQLAALTDQGCEVRQLQTQIDFFAEFAELFNLPQFKATVQTVQQALALHPEQASEIAQLALTEFESSRQAVLAGDLTGGAGPSNRLIKLAAAQAKQPNEPSEAIDDVSGVIGGAIAESAEAIVTETAEIAAVTDAKPPEPPLEIDLSLLKDIFGNTNLTSSKPKNSIAEIIEQNLEINHELENTYQSDDLIQTESEIIEAPIVDQFPSIFTVEKTATSTEELPEQLTADPVMPHRAKQSSQPSQPNLDWRSAVSSSRLTPMTVRVDSDRLERMNNLVGELGINRSSLSLHNDQLQKVLRELRNRFSRFRGAVNRLQKLSDQIVIAPERTGLRASPKRAEALVAQTLPSAYAISFEASAAEFDALEMDRYGAGYFELQAILEDLLQLEESIDDITLFSRQSSQTLDQQETQLTQLRDELVWSRMLPLSEILHRFPRVLRDLSVTYQKPVNLNLVGAEVLIDRAILEKLYDPLLHLLRNAFDHGIESVHLRQQQGKPEQGQIEIRAFHQGNRTVIEVQDDGQGVNLERIRQRVIELRWLSAEQVAAMPAHELLELIFEPGFSTASQVSELSGRGFGLDVVRSQLQSMRGTVTATSLPGKGTMFALSLPLTLTITQVIICLAEHLPLALPVAGIIDILTPESAQLQQIDHQQHLSWREQVIPIYSLAHLLYYACPVPAASANRLLTAFPIAKDWSAPVIVLRNGQQSFALMVDQILTEQELLIKPFGSAITSPGYMYGCTILGDGSPIPVIDAAMLVSLHLQSLNSDLATDSVSTKMVLTRKPALTTRGTSSGTTDVKSIQLPTILVVDDAVTLRRTLALFLEREGFRVLQAQDGQEAIEQLHQHPAVKLIVCDIEMPKMNGFEFLSYRRKNSQITTIPIVILTSRSNEKHRRLAMQLGATAYFTKPYLEQELLTVVKTLL